MSPHVSIRHMLSDINFYTFYLQKHTQKTLIILITKHLWKKGNMVTGLLKTLFASAKKLTPISLRRSRIFW